MDIEFDPAKDQENVAKHGASLRFALVILSSPMGDVVDARFSYGEVRRLAFAQVDGVFWACAYTVRDEVVRPISVHRVREKEVRRWLRE